MAVSWTFGGFIVVIIVATLFTLPQFYTLPFEEALNRSQLTIIIIGMCWLLISPVALTISLLYRRLTGRGTEELIEQEYQAFPER